MKDYSDFVNRIEENAILQYDGMSITSSCTENLCMLTLSFNLKEYTSTFKLSVDIDNKIGYIYPSYQINIDLTNEIVQMCKFQLGKILLYKALQYMKEKDINYVVFSSETELLPYYIHYLGFRLGNDPDNDYTDRIVITQKGYNYKVRVLISISACVLFIAFFFSCKKDKGLANFGDYPNEVGKIISLKCATEGCHNDLSYQAASGLNLTTWESMFKGGNSGASVIPYRSDFSPLCYFINSYSDLGIVGEPIMPINRDKLTREEVITINKIKIIITDIVVLIFDIKFMTNLFEY
jgi:hypothetical protein